MCFLLGNLPCIFISTSKIESNRIMQLILSLSKQRAPVLGQGTAGAVYWQEVSGVSTVHYLAAGGSELSPSRKRLFIANCLSMGATMSIVPPPAVNPPENFLDKYRKAGTGQLPILHQIQIQLQISALFAS